MKKEKKREIEAKLLKLIFESQKPKKSENTSFNTTCHAKVIRRRKGNPDLHIG